MHKATLTFATRYNGVFVRFDESAPSETEELWSEIDDAIGDLAEYTHKWTKKFNHSLSDKKKAKLIKKATKILKELMPTRDFELTFEYDHHTS